MRRRKEGRKEKSHKSLEPRTRNSKKKKKEGEMSKSCKGLAVELVKCLSQSDCIKVEKKPMRECAKAVADCAGLRETYFNCKRGQVDMRARVRGNKGY